MARKLAFLTTPGSADLVSLGTTYLQNVWMMAISLCYDFLPERPEKTEVEVSNGIG